LGAENGGADEPSARGIKEGLVGEKGVEKRDDSGYEGDAA